MYIMYGISNLRSAGITWSMRYGRITYPVLTCSMPGWIGLNRGRVSTCSLTMGRVCKTCSARRSSAGPTLGSTGLLGSERDEKDYTFTCYIVIYIYFYTWKLVTALMYWCCLINDMKDFQLPTLLLFKHMILVQRSIHYIVNFLLIIMVHHF